MVKVTASHFRKNMFDYLDQVTQGETIVILRNDVEVARITGMSPTLWREKMRDSIEFLVSPDELMAPVDDIWEDYT